MRTIKLYISAKFVKNAKLSNKILCDLCVLYGGTCCVTPTDWLTLTLDSDFRSNRYNLEGIVLIKEETDIKLVMDKLLHPSEGCI